MFYNKTLLDAKSKIEKQFRQDKEKYENKNNPTPWEESYLRYRIKKLEETKKVLEKLQNEKEKVDG